MTSSQDYQWFMLCNKFHNLVMELELATYEREQLWEFIKSHFTPKEGVCEYVPKMVGKAKKAHEMTVKQ